MSGLEDEDEIPTLIEHSEASTDGQDKLTGKRVPCTLISGFLGAGKSTLLKRILTERHGYRIAVIMNEFGDTAIQDIEAKIINISSEGGGPGELSEEFLELANGCLCCSIKDTGVAAIENLMRKKGAFDYILLETTGLADPGPIASMFWHNEEFATGLGQDIYLDGVITVVDAFFCEKQMAEEQGVGTLGVSLRQIACADVVLLNKSDLVSVGELVKLETTIQEVNPAAPIYRTIRGEVDLRNVIGLNAYASRLAIQPAVLSPEGQDLRHAHTDVDHTHPKPSTSHEGISSLQVSCPVMSSAQTQKLDEWIRAALWDGHLLDDEQHEVEVLRCKGVYMIEGGEQYVLQGVRNLYEIKLVEGDVDVGLPEDGKLVFIGKGLDEEARKSLLSVVG